MHCKKKKYTQTVEDGLIKKRGSGQSRRKNFHLVKGNLLNKNKIQISFTDTLNISLKVRTG